MKYVVLFVGIFVFCLTNVESNPKHGPKENRNYSSLKIEEGNGYQNLNDGDDFQKERIAGGRKINKISVPYFASLSVTKAKAEIILCGGSLISPRHVLTAASCLAGSLSINISFLQRSNRLTYDVTSSSITIHPDYVSATHSNDIAIVVLPDDAALNPKIKPVRLPLRATLPLTYVGSTAKIYGYGAFKHFLSSKWLRSAQDRIIENTECARSHTNIAATHICMNGRKGRTACNGDIGGPITIKDNSGKTVLVAVISLGPTDCKGIGRKVPTVGSRVVNYLDFISTVTGIVYP